MSESEPFREAYYESIGHGIDMPEGRRATTPPAFDEADDVHRVRLWKESEPPNEPDEVVPLNTKIPVIWRNDPHTPTQDICMDIHPDDRPGTLNVFMAETGFPTPGGNHVDRRYWDDPEYSVEFPADWEFPTLEATVGNRILFQVTRGNDGPNTPCDAFRCSNPVYGVVKSVNSGERVPVCEKHFEWHLEQDTFVEAE